MLGYVAIVHIYLKTNINILIEMWWLIWGDVVAQLVARNTSRAEVPGTNPTPCTMILGHCRIIV